MKIDGIEIIRISDFRRFFRMEDFMANRERYTELLREADMEIFCDTKRERELISQLRGWMSGLPLTGTFRDDSISLPGGEWIGLGEIADILSEYRDKLPYNDRIGLAYLMVLMKPVWDIRAMRDNCRLFADYRSGNYQGEYCQIFSDCEFTQASAGQGKRMRRFLVNTTSPNGYHIRLGNKLLTLGYREAIAGIFNENGECETHFS